MNYDASFTEIAAFLTGLFIGGIGGAVLYYAWQEGEKPLKPTVVSFNGKVKTKSKANTAS